MPDDATPPAPLASTSMITDVHRPRLLPYAASMAPLSKAGDVARQMLLTADIRAACEWCGWRRVVRHVHDIDDAPWSSQGVDRLSLTLRHAGRAPRHRR